MTINKKSNKLSSFPALHSEPKKKTRKIAKPTRSNESQITSSKFKPPIDGRLVIEAKAQKKTNANFGVTSTISEDGGVTMQQGPSDADPEAELQVVKSVVLRENYLKRVQMLRDNDKLHAKLEKIVDILDLVRVATVEVVEAIAVWKKSQLKPHPFIWSGMDYLLKIPSDLDYLNEWEALVSWLGFSMKRNPFIVPGGLEATIQDSSGTKTQAGATIIGGHSVPDSGMAMAKHGKRPTVTTSAYSTPVVNYGFGNLNVKKEAMSTTGKKQSFREKSQLVLPSHIGAVDLLRIKESQKAIKYAENIGGRYQLDCSGRLVSEKLASRSHSISALQQNSSQSRASIDLGAKVVHDPTITSRNLALRHGGSLIAVSKEGTRGTTRIPLKRTRGAQIEEEILLAKRQNVILVDTIEKLNEKIDIVSRSIQDAINIADAGSVAMDVAPELAREQEVLSLELSNLKKTLNAKEMEVLRREEAMEAFKTSQATAIDEKRRAEIEKRRAELSSSEVLPEDEEMAVAIEHASATSMQRIVRGNITRNSYFRLQIEQNIASTKIQSGIRRFLARRMVSKLYFEKNASIVLQKLFRGTLARSKTRVRRQQIRHDRAATRIQTIARRRFGVARMQARRVFIKCIGEMQDFSHVLFPSDLAELGDYCSQSNLFSSPPSCLLGLVQAVILLTSHPNDDASIPRLTWRDAGNFLQRSNKVLRRLRYISYMGQRCCLVIAKPALNLMRAYDTEPTFNANTFGSLPRGSKAATHLFVWARAVIQVYDVQHRFVLDTEEYDYSIFSESLLDEDLDSIEEKHHKSKEEQAAQDYIPQSLLLKYPKRPRPILCVISRDIPETAKENILLSMTSALPGLFLRMSCNVSEIARIQNVLNVGHSILLEVDIGLSATHRKIFIGNITSLKAALHPTPLCLLVQGNRTNRRDDISKLGVSRSDMALMQDADMKEQLESMASCLHVLGLDDSQSLMKNLSEENNPQPVLVHIMQAIIILLTPDQKFKGPDGINSSISWRISRKLIATPKQLIRSLRDINSDGIPPQNLEVIKLYIAASIWPSLGIRSSMNAIVLNLSNFVEACTNYATKLEKMGGPAPQITRRSPPGIFSSVISVHDSVHFSCDEPLAASLESFQSTDDGWRQSACSLLGSLLEDVRVYRESIHIGSHYVTVNVYRDCSYIYFCSYCPATSSQHYTAVHENKTSFLLAPYSIDIGSHSVVPTTTDQLYSRLVQLCTFESIAKSESSDALSLRIRRKMIRLCREIKKISGYYTTITISELSMGMFVISAFVQKGCQTLDLRIDGSALEKIRKNASIEEIEAIQNNDVAKITSCFLDRIGLYHQKKNKPVKNATSKLSLHIRTKGGPGKIVIRMVAKNASGKSYIFTIHEVGLTSNLRLTMYNAKYCQFSEITISQRQKKYLIEISPKETRKWSIALFKRLSIKSNKTDKKEQLQFNSRIKTMFYSMVHEVHASELVVCKQEIRCLVKVDAAKLDGSLCFHIYLPQGSLEYEHIISDAVLNFIAEKESIKWPPRMASDTSTAIMAVLKLFFWSKQDKCVVFIDPYSKSRYLSRNVPLKLAINGISSGSRPTSAKFEEAARVVKTARSNPSIICLYRGSIRSNGGDLLSLKLVQRMILRDVLTNRRLSRAETTRREGDFELLLTVYNPKCSSEVVCTIYGRHDLLEVIGPHNSFLADLTHVPQLLQHIVHERLVVSYTQQEDGPLKFDATLIRSRLYNHDKLTPINVSGERDVVANADTLLENADARGKKIVSKAANINGSSLIITIFELKSGTLADIPAFRVNSYDTVKSKKSILYVSSTEVIELIEQEASLLEQEHRRALALKIIDNLSLQYISDGTTRLMLAKMDSVLEAENSKSRLVGSKKHQIYHSARTIGESSVICTVYYCAELEQESEKLPQVLLHVYDPSCSAQATIHVNVSEISESVEAMLSTLEDTKNAMNELFTMLNIIREAHQDGTTTLSLSVQKRELSSG